MDNIKDDIKFLLAFVPEIDPDRVLPDLPNMFYLTGKYEGDVEIATRAKEIINHHGIDPCTIARINEDEKDVY